MRISLNDLILGLIASFICLITMFSFLYWWRFAIFRPNTLHGGPHQSSQLKIPGYTLPPTPTPHYRLYSPTQLKLQMVDLINLARAANNAPPLAWDDLAAQLATQHATDMLTNDYFSHWNNLGLGPDHRYTLIGGQHAAMENLYAYQAAYDNGQGAPITDWGQLINDAHTGLMSSPGHRQNILDPTHTHVGIGLAYNEQNGQLRLVQIFTNQYFKLTTPLPREANLGDTLAIHGHFPQAEAHNILINLAYEPFRTPLDQAAYQSDRPYNTPAQPIAGWSSDPNLYHHITFDYDNGPGLYHLRIFADIKGHTTLVVNHVIAVR
ncbi:MAG TPA: CAP domain-containing protein [Anaerolineae bacterium]|nr:CAP domain-containing protein [Anaerolineae bacterium]